MNAPAKFLPTQHKGEPTPFLGLALKIAAGDMSGLPRHEHDWFSPSEWREAAEEWLDGSDRTALPRCIEVDRKYQDFIRWQNRDYEHRQFCDFLTWLDEQEAWQRELAMTPVGLAR